VNNSTADKSAQKGLWTAIDGAALLARGLVYPFTTARFRQKVRSWYTRNLYEKALKSAKLHKTEPGIFPDGINVLGYLTAESGVGEGARSTIRAALAAGIPTAAREIRRGIATRHGETTPEGVRSGTPFRANILHANADETPVAFMELGADTFRYHFNAGFWYWEQPAFPAKWDSSFLPFDEIWVASEFCREAISARSPVPVVLMPPCVQPDTGRPFDRSGHGINPDDFLFLIVADLLSVPERKNIEASVNAFHSAFPEPRSGTALAIKLINTQLNRRAIERIREAAGNSHSIFILDRNMDRSELNGLYQACDCVVSLHRAEGFGLTLAEGMFFGKPALATGWSGNMEFMNSENSLPVDYKLVELHRDTGPYERGWKWAEPSVEHAAHLMREVASKRVWSRKIGERGQRDILERFSPSTAGKRIADHLANCHKPHAQS